MALRSRRTVGYLALVVLTTALFTLLYNVGMAVWEGRPQPLYRSLEVVVQSFTTTGYGEDAGWQSPQMNLIVIVMQLAGIGLILTAVDVFAVPWLRDAVSPTAPQRVDDLADHVVVCEHTPRTEVFLDELEARGRDYVLVESDADVAADLHEAGSRVVHGDPEEIEDLRAAGVESATTVVADAGDDRNTSIVLAAHDVNPEVRAITIVEDATIAPYHRAAGADVVLSPRQLLGRSLAHRVPTPFGTDVDEGVELGEDVTLVELAIDEGSDLVGQTVGEAGLRERFGVDVIGTWRDGTFETPITATDELAADCHILVVGSPEAVESLEDATNDPVRRIDPSPVLIAGYGDSGRAAAETLRGTGVDLRILDIADGEGVEVVGDARDPDVLEAAGVADARALVITLADDAAAIMATVVARELNPDLHVVVRANEEADVQKLYRAGADFVQSLSVVSGRMLASTVFEDEEVLSYEQQIRVARFPVGALAGSTLAAERVPEETDCTLVGVVRDGETLTDLDPESFVFEPDDEVVVAGTDDAITAYEERYVP